MDLFDFNGFAEDVNFTVDGIAYRAGVFYKFYELLDFFSWLIGFEVHGITDFLEAFQDIFLRMKPSRSMSPSRSTLKSSISSP